MKGEFEGPKVEKLLSSGVMMEKIDIGQPKIEPRQIESPKTVVEKSEIGEAKSSKADFPIQKPDKQTGTHGIEKTKGPQTSQNIGFNYPKIEKLQTESDKIFTPIQSGEKPKIGTQDMQSGKNQTAMERPDFDPIDKFASSSNSRIDRPDFLSSSPASGSSSPDFGASDRLLALTGAIEKLVASLDPSKQAGDEYEQPHYTNAFERDHNHSGFFHEMR